MPASKSTVNVEDLLSQNEVLRSKLRDFTKRLDVYMQEGHSTPKSPGKLTTSSCAQHEGQIASLNKRVDMLLRENAALKKDLQHTNPERVANLDNEMAVLKNKNKQLVHENKTLQSELRTAREGLAKLPSDLKAIRDQEITHAATVERYREQMKQYLQRHDQDMRTMRQQALQIAELEKDRKERSAAAPARTVEKPVVLPPLSPSANKPAAKKTIRVAAASPAAAPKPAAASTSTSGLRRPCEVKVAKPAPAPEHSSPVHAQQASSPKAEHAAPAPERVTPAPASPVAVPAAVTAPASPVSVRKEETEKEGSEATEHNAPANDASADVVESSLDGVDASNYSIVLDGEPMGEAEDNDASKANASEIHEDIATEQGESADTPAGDDATPAASPKNAED